MNAGPRALFLRAAALALLAAPLAGCDGDDGISPRDANDSFAEETFSHTFATAQHSRLQLTGINGDIEVATGTEIRIEGTRRVGSFEEADAEASLDKLDVIVIDTGATIEVETRQPDHDFRTYEVDYRLTVPDGVELVISNVNGAVSVAARSGSAGIYVVNGAVLAEMSVPPDGYLDLRAVNGLLDLAVPVDTSAIVSVTMVNASFLVQNLPIQASISTSNQYLGTLGDGEASIELSTVNGTIVLRGV